MEATPARFMMSHGTKRPRVPNILRLSTKTHLAGWVCTFLAEARNEISSFLSPSRMVQDPWLRNEDHNQKAVLLLQKDSVSRIEWQTYLPWDLSDVL